MTHCGVLIWTTTSTKSTRFPLTPNTLTVKFPVDALPLAVMVRVEEDAVLGADMTGLGMVMMTPAGLAASHEADSATRELKPALETTEILSVAL